MLPNIGLFAQAESRKVACFVQLLSAGKYCKKEEENETLSFLDKPDPTDIKVALSHFAGTLFREKRAQRDEQ